MRSQVLKSHAFSLRRRGKSTKGERKLHHPHEEQISSKQLLWPQPAPGPCRTGPQRTASARRPPRRSPELQLVQALQQAAGAVGHGGGAAEAPLVGFRVDLRLSHLNLRGGAAKRSPASPAAASGESRGRRRRRHRAGRPPPSDARGGRPGRMRRHRRRRRGPETHTRPPPQPQTRGGAGRSRAARPPPPATPSSPREPHARRGRRRARPGSHRMTRTSRGLLHVRIAPPEGGHTRDTVQRGPGTPPTHVQARPSTPPPAPVPRMIDRLHRPPHDRAPWSRGSQQLRLPLVPVQNCLLPGAGALCLDAQP